jgi:hypothetical protein
MEFCKTMLNLGVLESRPENQFVKDKSMDLNSPQNISRSVSKSLLFKENNI